MPEHGAAAEIVVHGDYRAIGEDLPEASTRPMSSSIWRTPQSPGSVSIPNLPNETGKSASERDCQAAFRNGRPRRDIGQMR